MTLAAFSLRRDVINLLRCCNTRVVAGCTIAVNDTRTMDKGVSECSKCSSVTRRTIQIWLYQISLYMTQRLTFADITVMAGRTIVSDTCVTKRRISKARMNLHCSAIKMAVIASESGWYVIRQFTHTDYIVVARFTIISDTDVIIGASGKGTWGMANTTILIDVDIDDVERHVLVDSREGKR